MQSLKNEDGDVNTSFTTMRKYNKCKQGTVVASTCALLCKEKKRDITIISNQTISACSMHVQQTSKY